jgi:hypothetical protein
MKISLIFLICMIKNAKNNTIFITCLLVAHLAMIEN